MVRGVLLFLDRGEASIDAYAVGAAARRLLAAFPDESSARMPRPLFACRMDRVRHLGRPRFRPARPELACHSIREASATTREKSAFEKERHSSGSEASCILLKANRFAIDDSFSPYRAAYNSDLWPHGRHWPFGRRIPLAGRF